MNINFNQSLRTSQKEVSQRDNTSVQQSIKSIPPFVSRNQLKDIILNKFDREFAGDQKKMKRVREIVEEQFATSKINEEIITGIKNQINFDLKGKDLSKRNQSLPQNSIQRETTPRNQLVLPPLKQANNVILQQQYSDQRFQQSDQSNNTYNLSNSILNHEISQQTSHQSLLQQQQLQQQEQYQKEQQQQDQQQQNTEQLYKQIKILQKTKSDQIIYASEKIKKEGRKKVQTRKDGNKQQYDLTDIQNLTNLIETQQNSINQKEQHIKQYNEELAKQSKGIISEQQYQENFQTFLNNQRPQSHRSVYESNQDEYALLVKHNYQLYVQEQQQKKLQKKKLQNQLKQDLDQFVDQRNKNKQALSIIEEKEKEHAIVANIQKFDELQSQKVRDIIQKQFNDKQVNQSQLKLKYNKQKQQTESDTIIAQKIIQADKEVHKKEIDFEKSRKIKERLFYDNARRQDEQIKKQFEIQSQTTKNEVQVYKGFQDKFEQNTSKYLQIQVELQKKQDQYITPLLKYFPQQKNDDKQEKQQVLQKLQEDQYLMQKQQEEKKKKQYEINEQIKEMHEFQIQNKKNKKMQEKETGQIFKKILTAEDQKFFNEQQQIKDIKKKQKTELAEALTQQIAQSQKDKQLTPFNSYKMSNEELLLNKSNLKSIFQENKDADGQVNKTKIHEFKQVKKQLPLTSY